MSRQKTTYVFLRWFILCLAVLLLVLGIYRNEMNDVFIKAVNICTECIGIG